MNSTENHTVPNTSSHSDHLAGEHAFTDSGQIMLLLLFLAVWIVDSFVIRVGVLLSAYVPLYVRIPIAAVFLAAGAALSTNAHRMVFGTEYQQLRVISTGVFSFVRHPMYLGSILVFFSFFIATLSLLAVAVWAVIVVFYFYVSHHEEKLLLRKFGTGYEQYRHRVPMLFPLKLRRR